MSLAFMQLKILLPSRVYGEIADVTRIVAEARGGSFGILPHRLDCVAALAPGILTYAMATGGDVYVAVDEGVLIKTGLEVMVSVHHAVGGTDLGQLRETIEREFLALDDREKEVQRAVAKLESGFIRRFASFIVDEVPKNREEAFARKVGEVEARRLRTKRRGVRDIWLGLGMFGLIGWSVAIPTFLGVMLGAFIDERYPGVHSWTLSFLIIGLFIGCLNAWHWVSKEEKAIREDEEDQDD